MKRSLILAITSNLLLSGCGIFVPMSRSESNLKRLNLGMTRIEGRKAIGDPTTTRIAHTLDNGETVNVEEYFLYPDYQPALNFGLGIITLGFAWFFPLRRYASDYLVEYRDGKLVRWGQAGDVGPNVSGELTVHNK